MTEITQASRLADLSAGELLEGYRAKRFSPVEVLDSVLDRVAADEPRVRATWAMDSDGAREVARASERRWRQGTRWAGWTGYR